MKITKQSLRQIIKEEYNTLLNEVKPGYIYSQEPGGGGDYVPKPPPEQGNERKVGRSGSVSFVDARVKFIEKFAVTTGKPFSKTHAETYKNLININPPDGKFKHVKAFEAYVKDPSEQNLQTILSMF